MVFCHIASLIVIHLSLLSEFLRILPSLFTTGVFLGSGLTLQVQGLPHSNHQESCCGSLRCLHLGLEVRDLPSPPQYIPKG